MHKIIRTHTLSSQFTSEFSWNECVLNTITWNILKPQLDTEQQNY